MMYSFNLVAKLPLLLKPMPNNKSFFWFAHISGWSIYMALILIINYFDGGLSVELIKSAGIITLVGFLITSLLKNFYTSRNWHRRNFAFIMGRSVVSALICGVIYHVLVGLLNRILFPERPFLLANELSEQLEMFISWAFLILFWSILFFTSNYFIGYRIEQIKALKLEADNKNFELKQLKSQLNPHFMFNALTSIRALIDEDKNLAKDAILNLSAMLRKALNVNNLQLVPLAEEIELVNNYIELEKRRFEEKLQYISEVDTATMNVKVPPIMLQTLVENAVKHGVSNLEQGGVISLKAFRDGNFLIVDITNDGRISEKNKGTGVGLTNTRRRLTLIYQDKAELNLFEKNNKVVCELKIPIHYENTNN